MRTTLLALTALASLTLAACDDGAGTTGSIEAPADPNAVVVEPATPETPTDDTTTTIVE